MSEQAVGPRVLIFIHSLHGGGAERVAADLSAHWVEQGREVMLVTQAPADGDVYTLDPRVQRRVLNTVGEGGGLRGVLANVRRVAALRALIKSFRPDIVLGMMTTASVLAVIAARGLRCRVIATEHTHPPSQTLSGMWQRLRRLTYPRAARVVALTRGTADWLDTHVPGSRLAVIPNPVHWPLPRSEPVVAPTVRPERKYVLGVGRLHADKGFDVLIEAFARVAQDHPDWDLILLGEGNERSDLQARIDAAGLAERIQMPGRVGNVGDWYAAAHLYALSSHFEGLSNTLLESMASGLMAVSFDCDTGPREIIRDQVDGVLVRPVGDAISLSKALSRMMEDPAGRARMGELAQNVRERFSAEHVLDLWQKVFEEALGASRHG